MSNYERKAREKLTGSENKKKTKNYTTPPNKQTNKKTSNKKPKKNKKKRKETFWSPPLSRKDGKKKGVRGGNIFLQPVH